MAKHGMAWHGTPHLDLDSRSLRSSTSVLEKTALKGSGLELFDSGVFIITSRMLRDLCIRRPM